ncbi:DUF1648 domain-containing protein [Microbacterium sp. M1A1_1b]
MSAHDHASPRTAAQGQPTRLLSPALLLAAVMSWFPPGVLVLVRLTSSDVPARVPTHWSGAGVVDGWGSSTFAFWSLLVPGVVGAFICSVLAVVLATDTTRIKAAVAIGLVSAVTGGIASAWFTMALSATGSSAALLPVLAAVVWGGLVFGICLLRRNPVD